MASTESTPIALDIETVAAPDFENYEKAALDLNRSLISLVGAFDGRDYFSTRSLRDLSILDGSELLMHNGKFDMRTLLAKGAPVKIESYKHDTMLQAVALPYKIPELWLEEYEVKRKELNKSLGCEVHRRAGKHSLKTLAVYFLGVDPFWEVADHNDEQYNRLDCEYTFKLWQFMNGELKACGGLEFYKNHLMPWSRMLTLTELRGIAVDNNLLGKFEIEYAAKGKAASEGLREAWAPIFDGYLEEQKAELTQQYADKSASAVAKLAPSKKKDPIKAADENEEKRTKTLIRYDAMLDKAMEKVEPLNLASPAQLSWVLTEQLGLNIANFKGDDSTGKAVLQRLADQGRDDIKLLLDYREATKLTTAFFPTYRTMQWEGAIHASFNMNGTRTGRLSSSDPNLQQVSKKIQSIFKARPGYKFVYRDVSAIEPRLIAYHTECPVLCGIFLNGTDFHSENVRAIMGIQEGDKQIKEHRKDERDFIKEFGLSLMYGAMSKRIEESAIKRKFPRSAQQCERDYYNFRDKYHVVFEYKEELENHIKSGATIHNLLGRPLSYEGASLRMTSLNTLIQSGGSDILLDSAEQTLAICKDRGIEAHLVAAIHDAAIIEVPENNAEEVDALLDERIRSWKLETKYGLIPMSSDGKIVDHL